MNRRATSRRSHLWLIPLEKLFPGRTDILIYNFSSYQSESLSQRLYWLLRTSVQKKYLENDLLVPFCLQERSGKDRIRGHACTSCIGIFLFLCKGVACVPSSHPSQTPTSSSLSRALRWHGSLDKTALY